MAGNAKYDDLAADFPAIVYMPFEQNLDVPVGEMTFFLRTAGDPLAFANAVRDIVHKADARIPVTHLTTQSSEIDGEMSQETLFARLCTGFAILAPGDCLRGAIRNDVLYGRAPYGRDWNSHGAGRATRCGALDGAARGFDPGCSGSGNRRAYSPGHVEICRLLSLWTRAQ